MRMSIIAKGPVCKEMLIPYHRKLSVRGAYPVCLLWSVLI